MAVNYLSNSKFKIFMQFYKKCISKLNPFEISDANLLENNPLRFRHNILERIHQFIMKIDD